MDNDLSHAIDPHSSSLPLDGLLRKVGTHDRIVVADREWARIQLAGENRLLEMIASGDSLRDVLDALCNFVETMSPECSCGVYLIDWSGPTFQLGAAPSLPDSYTEPIEGLPVRCEIAPCAVAALLKKQVISADLRSDPLWQSTPYCAHVVAHGLRSVWSTPISSRSGQVLGTFAIYHRNPALPSGRLQDLIAQVTHIASIAIERAQAEARLKRNEILLAEGQRLSSTGTFWWRVATDDVQWSDESFRIYEFDSGTSLTFELLAARVHPDDASFFMAKVEEARLSGNDFDFEYRLTMPNGSTKYVHVVAHATCAPEGHREYIGALQDVTERRLSEEALGKLRSELAHVARVASLGALTASVAHEVNQPLSGIITNASTCLRMLASDPPNVEGARETARRTIRDANRASDVITRLRALFEKKSIVAEPMDLNEATREVLALSSSELHRGRVVVHAELSDDMPVVVADRVQLQQVILNLIRNAADAMSGVEDRSRLLTIRTEREEGDCVRVSVRDVGVGMNPDDADRMFDAFFTTKADGMGMGLSVSRSIIQNHRGRLWATPNDGPGTTFAFSIPRRPVGTASFSISGGTHAPAASATGARSV